MRLDLFLTVSRLVKRRSAAQTLIEEGRVRAGGVAAKAGRQLAVGDELEIRTGSRMLRIRVLDLPGKRVSKAAARGLYEVVDEKRLAEEPREEGAGGPIDFLAGR